MTPPNEHGSTQPASPLAGKHHTADDIAAAGGTQGTSREPVSTTARAPQAMTTGDATDHVSTQDVATHDTPAKKSPPLAALVLGLPVVLCLMLLAFATPAVHSGAHHLPIAVSGPSQAVAQLTKQLDAKAPGTFDVTTYATPAKGAEAITHRDAVGGIALTKDGVTIQTATGAGAPYAGVLKNVGAGLEPQLAKEWKRVTYTDLAPLPSSDPSGAAMTSAGLPLIFGGMATSAAMFFTMRGRTGRRALGVFGVAVVGGLAAAAVLHTMLDVVDGSFWLLAAAFAMGIAAIAFTVLGLAKNLGAAGFGLGAVLMLFVSNPISGLGTGAAWLPQPWGAIGQYLPVGAAGTALRSAAYFDGHGATHAWIVLTCWALAGLALLAVGKRRGTTH